MPLLVRRRVVLAVDVLVPAAHLRRLVLLTLLLLLLMARLLCIPVRQHGEVSDFAKLRCSNTSLTTLV